MRISRVRIENFRTFKALEFRGGDSVVVVGENKVGKSNLLHALRLVLDPSLPDTARQLREEDFWDGLSRPLKKTDAVVVEVELEGFEKSEPKLALLAEHLIKPNPMVARLTYKYRAKGSAPDEPVVPTDFEFVMFGGDREENYLNFEVRRSLPLIFFHALRDAESDLENWRRSPLRPLLDDVAKKVDGAKLKSIAKDVTKASDAVAGLPEVDSLAKSIAERIQDMVGPVHAIDTTIQVGPTDPTRLLRNLRLYFDHGRRTVSEASLGSANVLYLALTLLEFQRLVGAGDLFHTFLAVEEPEAHLHPHVQRLVYRDALRTSSGKPSADRTVILTTHSPHIASVTPLRSLVLLSRKNSAGTSATSVAGLDLEADVVADIERYIDVTRGEILFSRSVLFVEGEAERYLLPAISRLMKNGQDLDSHGVSICSVSGTHFSSYVKVFGHGFKLPFAVITDGDPDDQGMRVGLKRAVRLAKILDEESLDDLDDTEKTKRLNGLGLFVGEETLEWDLFNAGHQDELLQSLIDLAGGKTALKRAETWLANPPSVTKDKLLADVESIGKGRFAQHLSTKLKGNFFPAYITKAIRHAIKSASAE
ncbi:ATP-dependent nuclease [Hyalangium versicolor]|uniref:ATP-dependent nuclease n=1 Tax=Hyalangium versicolor TaxID=2861190 RepID=UPI001CCFFC9F|nr:AAA family ATPase [Hyalangium versicolor]